MVLATRLWVGIFLSVGRPGRRLLVELPRLWLVLVSRWKVPLWIWWPRLRGTRLWRTRVRRWRIQWSWIREWRVWRPNLWDACIRGTVLCERDANRRRRAFCGRRGAFWRRHPFLWRRSFRWRQSLLRRRAFWRRGGRSPLTSGWLSRIYGIAKSRQLGLKR